MAGDFAAAGTGAVSADFVGAALAGLAGAASSDFAASAATFMLVAPEVVCVSELVVLPLASAADVALPSTLLAVPSALLAVLSTLLAALEASFLSTEPLRSPCESRLPVPPSRFAPPTPLRLPPRLPPEVSAETSTEAAHTTQVTGVRRRGQGQYGGDRSTRK